MGDKRDVTKEEIENIRAGYQNAVALIGEEGGQYWSRYTALVYVNTAILVVIAAVLGSGGFTLIRIGLPILGIVLCLAWKGILDRSYLYYKYWMYSARELEEKLPPVQTLSRGEDLAEGKEVVLCLQGKKVRLRGKKGLRISTLATITIYLFIAVYLVIVADVLFRLIGK